MPSCAAPSGSRRHETPFQEDRFRALPSHPTLAASAGPQPPEHLRSQPWVRAGATDAPGRAGVALWLGGSRGAGVGRGGEILKVGSSPYFKKGIVYSGVVVHLCVCISACPPQCVCVSVYACRPMPSTTLCTTVCLSVDSGAWAAIPRCGFVTVGLCGAV